MAIQLSQSDKSEPDWDCPHGVAGPEIARRLGFPECYIEVHRNWHVILRWPEPGHPHGWVRVSVVFEWEDREPDPVVFVQKIVAETRKTIDQMTEKNLRSIVHSLETDTPPTECEQTCRKGCDIITPGWYWYYGPTPPMERDEDWDGRRPYSCGEVLHIDPMGDPVASSCSPGHEVWAEGEPRYLDLSQFPGDFVGPILNPRKREKDG